MGYFSIKDNDIILSGAENCEFYIPMEYFENDKFASDYGSTISSLGIFITRFYKEGRLIEEWTMAIPTWIKLYVYEYTIESVKLPGYDTVMNCKVLRYSKGAKVMESRIIEDSDNAVKYLRFITQGKIPRTIPYEKTLELWWKNQELNGITLGVPSIILELILSVCYRDKDDPSKKFSAKIGKDLSVSQYDYLMMSIRQICQYASTFTALTFEDFDSMVTSSLNKTREKKNETESPVEKVIKM